MGLYDLWFGFKEEPHDIGFDIDRIQEYGYA
jgi:hypothetical protein